MSGSFFVLVGGCKEHCDVEKRDYCPLKSKGPFVYVTKESYGYNPNRV